MTRLSKLALLVLLAQPLSGCLDMFMGAMWFACRGDMPGCGKHHKAEPKDEPERPEHGGKL